MTKTRLYQVTVNVDHESGEGAVAICHNQAEFYLSRDRDGDPYFHVTEDGSVVGTYDMSFTNLIVIQPIHI